MFKAIVTMKRKPGLSMEEFIDYYEKSHAPLGVKAVPNLKGYKRMYLRGYMPESHSGDLDNQAEPPIDVVTEIIFKNRDDFDRGMHHLSQPETAAAIAADEEKLFDRSTINFMIVEEYESDI